MSDLRTINPLAYPSNIHIRRHGPAGYENYTSYKPWLRDEFTFRCAYCLVRERWYPNGHAAFGVDHYLPQVTNPSRALDYDNLIYACNRCNAFKGDEDGVLNPCAVPMTDHLRFDDSGVAQPVTPEGAIHILVLDINGPEALEHRQTYVIAIKNAQHRGSERDHEFLQGALNFPGVLPDLRSKRPPGGNDRRLGTADCYFEQKKRGEILDGY